MGKNPAVQPDVEFESVTEQTIAPGADVVTEDPTLPAGYEEVTQSAHTGYVASFYKLVYVDGVLESRELVNRSTYNAYPRYVIRGTYVPETEPPQTETQAPADTQAPRIPRLRRTRPGHPPIRRRCLRRIRPAEYEDI